MMIPLNRAKRTLRSRPPRSHLIWYALTRLTNIFEAQTAITDAARKFPGFVGTEVLGPISGLQAEWVAIFRLESNQAMKRWLDSPDRAQLAARIEFVSRNPRTCCCSPATTMLSRRSRWFLRIV